MDKETEKALVRIQTCFYDPIPKWKIYKAYISFLLICIGFYVAGFISCDKFYCN